MALLPPTPPLLRWQRIATVGLFVIAVVACLWVARSIFIPIAGAVLLSFMLSPLIRPLIRRGFPAPVLAGVVVLAILGLVGAGILAASRPAMEWVDRLPTVTRQLDKKFRAIRESVASMEKASVEVINLTTANGKPKPVAAVVSASPSMLERFAEAVREVGLHLLMMLVLLYFLLAAGDMFKEKTVRLMPTFRDKRAVVSIVNTIEQEISGYLITITLINIALGVAIGAGLYAIGLENAVFWGLLAGLLNFVPYLGFMVGVALVSVAALLQFDTLGAALMAPLVYSLANLIESSFVTPSLLGRRFTINPVVMFLTIVFWSWLWGIPGALMAVPLTVALNVVCSHVPALAPLNEYLSGRPAPRNTET